MIVLNALCWVFNVNKGFKRVICSAEKDNSVSSARKFHMFTDNVEEIESL